MIANRYNLNDFKNIERDNTIDELNIAAIDIINAISKKVGAPTYRKTPVFRKKKNDNQNYKDKNLNATFKKTRFNNKEDENDINQDRIRGLLNKLTNNNYEEISQEIIMNIRHFVFSKNQVVLLSIGRAIFDISSENKFWVKLYAKLFNELIENFPIMNSICINNFNNFMSIFDNVEVCSEEDYDNFCRINKNNMKRRSLTLFYTNLYKLNLLGNGDIFSLLDKLFEKMFLSEHTSELYEEIFENISIIINNLSDDLSITSHWDNVSQKLTEIYELLKKNNKSKKIVFKLLDIFDELDIDYD
tara:strand:- start:389 stop:1294 length:906 start_codon:yes stop_codon:yes gene_type:complete